MIVTTPERAGLLGRTEQAVAALEQLAQVELQAAAHRADHVRLEFRIDEVLEVRQAVPGRHLEQQLGIRAVPVEILGHVVGRDREREHAALGVARHHHLDVGAVDHVHLGLQLAVAERHFDTADQRHLLAQIFRAHPVEGQVGKRRLRAPARRHVQVVDQLLDRLLDAGVIELVLAHIRRHVGIEGTERLRAGPFVLQRAEKIDDLPDCARHVLRRAGFDLARHAVQAFIEQGAQRPAGAIAGQHVEVMDVQIGIAMRVADLRRIHMAEPVIGDHLARHVEDQSAQRITLIGIGVDAPVALLQIFVHRRFDVDQRLAVVAQLLVLLPIYDIGAQGLAIRGIEQCRLDRILDLFDMRCFQPVPADGRQHYLLGEARRFPAVKLAAGQPCAGQCHLNFCRIKRLLATVALGDIGKNIN